MLSCDKKLYKITDINNEKIIKNQIKKLREINFSKKKNSELEKD